MNPWVWNPQPEVWLMVALLGGGYAIALRRLGPHRVGPGQKVASGGQIAAFGAGPAFAVNACSFVAVLAGLARIDRSSLYLTERLPRGKGQVRAGLRYAWSHPQLRATLFMVGVVGLFAQNFRVVLPITATEVLGGDAATYGWLTAAMELGAVVGALGAASRHTVTGRSLLLWTVAFGIVNLLTEKATGTSEGKAKKRSIDFGIDALDGILSDIDPENLRKCLAPRPDAPVLLPAHLDLLCQTAPAPAVEPDISLFLHGKERGVPEVRVAWRADFSTDNRQAWKEMAALCPPAQVMRLPSTT